MLLDKSGLMNEMKLKQETLTLATGEVLIQEVTATEYMEVFNSDEARGKDGEFDGTLFTSLLAVHCIIDQDGKRIFDDADAAALRDGSSSTFTKLIKVVKRLNGLGGDDSKN